MAITDLTISLILLFLPGLVTLFIIDTLATHKKWELYKYVYYAFILGFINYSIWYLLSLLPFLGIEKFYFIQSLIDKQKINSDEVFYVSIVIAIPFGFIATWIIEKKLIYRVARRLGISKKIGDSDIWSFTFNSTENTDWIVIRDYNNNIMIEGFVESFSDSSERDELLLSKVKVYENSSGELMYEIAGMYFAPERGKYIFEFPQLNYKKEK